jgi:DNA modification methylase
MGTFYEDATARLIHGDALELSQHIEPESVDLIITSPPYFALRSYKDGDEHYTGQIGDEPTPQQFLEALWKVTAQCQKVLKPGGNLFVNLGDKYQHKSLLGVPWRYAIGCTDGDAGNPWLLRAEIVWSKPNGLPESVTDRVRRSHETWFHFTRTQTSFASIDEIREPHKHQESPTARRGPSGPNRGTETGRTHDDGASVGNFNHNPLGRTPGSVWEIPLEPLRVPDWLGVEHFAAFPQEWPRRIIKGWSPTGFCVECEQPRIMITHTPHAAGNVKQKTKNGAALARGITNESSQLTMSGSALMKWRNENPTVSLGYACGCDNTNAPTTPAVVLDPFCGTGTVPMVARALGRYRIGVDLSHDYLKLAKWRVWDSGHATKSIRRNNLEAQTELFGDI